MTVSVYQSTLLSIQIEKIERYEVEALNQIESNPLNRLSAIRMFKTFNGNARVIIYRKQTRLSLAFFCSKKYHLTRNKVKYECIE